MTLKCPYSDQRIYDMSTSTPKGIWAGADGSARGVEHRGLQNYLDRLGGGSFFKFIGELPQNLLLTTKAPISVVVLGRRLTFRNCMGGLWNVGCRAVACSVYGAEDM